jgi:ferrous iron transport protein B
MPERGNSRPQASPVAGCHGEAAAVVRPPEGKRLIKVALAGQPNVGKSTLFNMLTGLNQHVGNWPGKTVEQKLGYCSLQEATLELVDLPGTYSLTANSEEERIARDYIIKERPDLVVLVADATNLERNLYLLAELLLLPAPIILALNMMDVAASEGLEINLRALEEALGVPVVGMSAVRNVGVRELLAKIYELACDPSTFRPVRPQMRPEHRHILAQLEVLLGEHVPHPYEPHWVALKLLEGDAEVTALAQQWLPPETWQQVHSLLLRHEDAILDIAGGRYEWIEGIVNRVISSRRRSEFSLTDRIDRYATHPFWGVLLLLAAATLSFFLVYSLGSPLQGLLEHYLVERLGEWLFSALAPISPWLAGFVVDGVLAGAGTMVTFVPILAIFFAVLGVFEDTGYMARAAFVMDRFMHAIGLHGRSFLPLLLGFGCNVPAVVGTRIIDSQRARLLSVLLAPLVPCTARLGVLTTLSAAFFGRKALVVSMSLIGANVLSLAALGLVLHRFIMRGEQLAFIMELPLYHSPNVRTIALFVWHHMRAFLVRAATIIVAASAGMWLLSTLPTGEISGSYLAAFGRLLSPVGQIMGFDWRLMVALLSSFVAKENSLATLSVLYAEPGQAVTQYLPQAITQATALAFLAAQMLFIPCVATVAAIRQETRSWRWTLADIGLLLILAILGGSAAYRVALLLGLPG